MSLSRLESNPREVIAMLTAYQAALAKGAAARHLHSPGEDAGENANAAYTLAALQSAMRVLEELFSAITRSEWLIGFDKKAQSRLRISFSVSWPGSPPDIRITRSPG